MGVDVEFGYSPAERMSVEGRVAIVFEPTADVHPILACYVVRRGDVLGRGVEERVVQ